MLETCTVQLHDEFPQIGPGFRTVLHIHEPTDSEHTLFYVPLLVAVKATDEQMRTICRHSFKGWSLPEPELLLAIIERIRYERQKAGVSFDKELTEWVLGKLRALKPPVQPVRVRTRRAA